MLDCSYDFSPHETLYHVLNKVVPVCRYCINPYSIRYGLEHVRAHFVEPLGAMRHFFKRTFGYVRKRRNTPLYTHGTQYTI